jgi:hypothetical protein
MLRLLLELVDWAERSSAAGQALEMRVERLEATVEAQGGAIAAGWGVEEEG